MQLVESQTRTEEVNCLRHLSSWSIFPMFCYSETAISAEGSETNHLSPHHCESHFCTSVPFFMFVIQCSDQSVGHAEIQTSLLYLLVTLCYYACFHYKLCILFHIISSPFSLVAFLVVVWLELPFCVTAMCNLKCRGGLQVKCEC